MHLKTKEVFIRKMRRLSIRDPSPSKRGGAFPPVLRTVQSEGTDISVQLIIISLFAHAFTLLKRRCECLICMTRA